MSKRRNAKSDKKAAREALNKDAPGSEIPEFYRAPIDTSKLDAKFLESPSLGLFMAWVQKQESKIPRKYEHVIDCGYQGCFDRTFHTRDRFTECILDKGGTEAEAQERWDRKIASDKYILHAGNLPPEPDFPIEQKAAPTCHTDSGDSGANIPVVDVDTAEPWPSEALGQVSAAGQVLEQPERPPEIAGPIEKPAPTGSSKVLDDDDDSLPEFGSDGMPRKVDIYFGNTRAGLYRDISVNYGWEMPGGGPSSQYCQQFALRIHIHGPDTIAKTVKQSCNGLTCWKCFVDAITARAISNTKRGALARCSLTRFPANGILGRLFTCQYLRLPVSIRVYRILSNLRNGSVKRPAL